MSFERLEEAFGPSSLGILLVKDLPPRFIKLRHKLLSYSTYLANLPTEELGIDPTLLAFFVHVLYWLLIYTHRPPDALTIPSSNYLVGWSHGKESLKSGAYDTLKGSYYVNCAFYQDHTLQSAPDLDFPDFPEYTASNVWPSEESLPGFRQTFEELCTLIIDTAVLVARACDRYATVNVEGYKEGYLEHVVKTSMTTKARLLHYFPPELSSHTVFSPKMPSTPQVPEEETDDSWCATHIDHGCLTGLTSALYVDEPQHSPNPYCASNSSPSDPKIHLPPLPSCPNSPSQETGLYIHSRLNKITKVSIPSSCLAFQTGEALELITGRMFRAVPHFVRMGRGVDGSFDKGRVARNTLAVFTQPNLGEVVGLRKGKEFTFGEFCREVVGRFG